MHVHEGVSPTTLQIECGPHGEGSQGVILSATGSERINVIG
jgi:hypothetical protein